MTLKEEIYIELEWIQATYSEHKSARKMVLDAIIAAVLKRIPKRKQIDALLSHTWKVEIDVAYNDAIDKIHESLKE